MIPLFLVLMVVVLLVDVGTTRFLHVPTTGTHTFHVTLMFAKYDVLCHTNGTDTFTSVSLTSLPTSSTLDKVMFGLISTPNITSSHQLVDVFIKSLIGISYDVMCIKLDMFDLYAST
ncbi:unnamed protein product [Spirodela intermedia]|uniref:Secreted protein n=1 Tax=Spirodela intermedia TaxID=51605 RepID=A0ABN7ECS4_SPIIN|nr:unnamed protein product [Spirodela intermedia]